MFPGIAAELAFLNLAVKIGNDFVTTVLDIIPFHLAVIPEPDLYHTLELSYVPERIEHDAGMGVFETFIGVTQVTVGVNLQNTILPVFFSQRFHITQGYAMITSEYTHQFILVQQGLALGMHPFSEVYTAFIYFFQGFAHELVGIHIIPL